MPSDSIFLLDGEDGLQEMEQTPYEREELLQRLLKQHPSLLAGQQIDGEDPPRWLLVSREMGIPDVEGGSDRWSLDHLFLDQNGIPTLVEVKRASDTRIRREVVGQMLDYAANAQKYWPVDRLRRLAEEHAGGTEALRDRLADVLGLPAGEDHEQEIESYWQLVEENLRSGHLRLLFVADHIPSELRRIIEFMNEKIPDVHVVGLELVQYRQGKLRVLVPRVVGQTEAALGTKARNLGGSARSRKTTPAEFLAACPAETRPFFETVVSEATQKGLLVYWGTRGFSVGITPDTHDRRATLLYGWPPGVKSPTDPVLEAYFHEDAFTPVEQDKAVKRLEAVAAFAKAGKYTVKLALNKGSLQSAREALDALWAIEKELRKP